MSKELIERLRQDHSDAGAYNTMQEAADLIEAQQKRIHELEAELMGERCVSFRNQVDDLSSKGYRLAFVLECILLATDSDMAAISKYWDEAHAALEGWRK